MGTSNVAIAAALFIGGAAYLAMAAYVWNRRHVPAANYLLASLTAIFIWATCYAVEMTTRSVTQAMIWNTAKYIGIVTLPPCLLAFAVEYTSRDRHFTARTLMLLSIEPLLVMGILVVPELRELMLVYNPKTMYSGSPWPYRDSGPLFYPHLVYSYVVVLSALVLLSWRLARLARPYRRPALVVIVVSLTALLANVIYNFTSTRLDLTPFTFVLVMTVLVWGFLRMGLLDLVPIARGAVMEQMGDAVLVLDAYNRVIDSNPAAAGLLGLPRHQLIGRLADVALPAMAPVLQQHRTGESTQHDISASAEELGRPASASPIHLAVQLNSLTDRNGREAGRLLVLRDITQRTETERRLRELLDAETHLAAVLQTSLRPASLPHVPRVSLAARSLPAGQGGQVSGDFYDVHQALGGDWAFVLGDVAGKGVHAAVVTSMARYTVRTLSAQGWSPKQVIEQLNQALLVDAEPERFCTVVYCRIAENDLDDDGQVPPGVHVTVALGGHPPPLVRRNDGRIEAVGYPGTALGIVSLVDIEEVSVDLAPGEVMIAYTDGITEARREGVEFGEERLAWTLASTASGLRGHTGQAAAALVADAVADRVMDVVTEFAEHRDDIALLVLAVA